MVFFSHEAALPTVIDPLVSVSAPDIRAGVGLQVILPAWQGDRHTTGSSIGSSGITSHNQLIFPVP